MGKHEIRLRREMMTSRRIERHKNYAGLMEQHHKTQRTRAIIRWVVYVLVFLMSLMLIYFAVKRSETKEVVENSEQRINCFSQGNKVAHSQAQGTYLINSIALTKNK